MRAYLPWEWHQPACRGVPPPPFHPALEGRLAADTQTAELLSAFPSLPSAYDRRTRVNRRAGPFRVAEFERASRGRRLPEVASSTRSPLESRPSLYRPQLVCHLPSVWKNPSQIE